MEIEERKKMIYHILRSHNRLTHNELWRTLQSEFVPKKDSFSNKTFEKTLKEMVDQGLVYREKDKKSKLGKIWYFPFIDFPNLEDNVLNNLETKVMVYDQKVIDFEKNFKKYDLYEKARRLSRLHILINLLEFEIIWFSKMYKNPFMKKTAKRMLKSKKRLDKLFDKIKTDRDEIRQLVVKNFERDEGLILQELHEK